MTAFDSWLHNAQRDLCENLLLIDLLADEPIEESEDSPSLFELWRRLVLIHPTLTLAEVRAALTGSDDPAPSDL